VDSPLALGGVWHRDGGGVLDPVALAYGLRRAVLALGVRICERSPVGRLGSEGGRSVETSWDAVRDVDPEMLILMPCGFHLEDGLEQWARTPRPASWTGLTAVRDSRVFCVDGSAYFSRPGPRVIDGVELLAELFDPEGSAGSAPFGSWVRVD